MDEDRLDTWSQGNERESKINVNINERQMLFLYMSA